LIYVAFLGWAAQRPAPAGIDGWDWIFVGLVPAQVGLIAGGGIVAKLTGRPDLALKWSVILLGCCLVVDGLIWGYYGIGSCLVVC
jgi:hypothetical protein